MLVRKLQDRQLSQEDAAFETKWQVSFRSYYDLATQFTIWKKFIATAPAILDRENYEEIPVKLWEEEFQIPPLKTSIHDNEIYSQNADSLQEFEAHVHEEQLHPHQKTLSIENLKQQLEIWSTRNLTIFLIEYLLDSEIKSLKILESGRSTELASLADRIPRIETLYQHILKMLNTADYYITEPDIYDPIYTSHPKKYNLEQEVSALRKFLDNLSMLGSSRQLELLKLKIRIESYGMVLPHSEDILKLASLSDQQCQQEMDTILAANKLAAEQAEAEKAAAATVSASEPESNKGSLRKSKRVTSHLHILGEACDSDDDKDDKNHKDDKAEQSLPAVSATVVKAAAPQQTQSSLGKNILFGIVVGLAVSILVAGVVAAVIFATAATFGGATLGFIFGGIFGAGIIGGFFGGVVKSCRQPTVGHQPSSTPSAQVKTNNADLHNRLGNRTGRSNIPSHEASHQPLSTIVTTPAPSAVLTSQNQEKTTASTLSVSRR